MSTPESPTDEVRCRCGYRASDPIVAPRTHHTVLGWILLSIGISSRPQQVDFRCPVCGFVFRSITDPAECERYRYK